MSMTVGGGGVAGAVTGARIWLRFRPQRGQKVAVLGTRVKSWEQRGQAGGGRNWLARAGGFCCGAADIELNRSCGIYYTRGGGRRHRSAMAGGLFARSRLAGEAVFEHSHD